MAYLKRVNLSTGSLRFIPSFVGVFNILIVLVFLPHCLSTPTSAPISSVQTRAADAKRLHRVRPGETLYAIAWRYDLDYKRLAIVNGIDRNYRIFPGQHIVLDDQAAPATTAPRVPERSQPARAQPRQTPPSVEPRLRHTPKAVALNPTPAQSARPLSSRSEKKSTAVSQSSSVLTKKKQLIWQWPAAGKVLTNFKGSQGLHKGIDIQGKKGDSVVAAAAGEVVYAGSGLRGYGNLVIIKHSDIYLSAYAHNDQIRVREGDVVTLGQHIATIGASGTSARNRPLLHFQVRRNGKPVDPLKVLPRRKP
ncbi:MAG: peptidoglycan DD-metalloendopeptidase family protein [Cellvibrionaceae bacterium]|nr:peptidoglycan DD-metalloendopeptidase family protein [Cellvibrionaceae bacterium]